MPENWGSQAMAPRIIGLPGFRLEGFKGFEGSFYWFVENLGSGFGAKELKFEGLGLSAYGSGFLGFRLQTRFKAVVRLGFGNICSRL